MPMTNEERQALQELMEVIRLQNVISADIIMRIERLEKIVFDGKDE